MGQEESNLIDESVPPQTLWERNLEAVAQLIRMGFAKKIVALTGAGISTAAGIPDFRSPGTGLYANLQRLNLPYAEAVFSIDYFRQNPRPFYVLAQELYPGHFFPSISHAFLALLAKKGLLRMLFTQNIDCLERAAGVPPDRIVEAHGSFASQRCIDCGTPFPDEAMREYVREARVPRCRQPGCGGLVKPDIVFFGEPLPPRFHELRHVAADGADLVLVMGTSLSVYPFAGLPSLAAPGVPRVLFNRERVGDLGTRPDDVLELGSCDAGVRKLAAALNWDQELEAFWRGIVGDAEADRQRAQDASLREEPAAEPKEPAAAEEEVNEIANEIAAVLNLNDTTEPLLKDTKDTNDIKDTTTTTETPEAKEVAQTDGAQTDGAPAASSPPVDTPATETVKTDPTPVTAPPPEPAPKTESAEAPAQSASPAADAPKEDKPQL